MIKNLIIDGDGVVINRDKRFTDRLCADYGITKETTAPFFNEVFRDCTIGKRDLKIELARYYRSWGWKGTLEELLYFWFSKEGLRNEEMLSTIQTLRASGVATFLATDNEKYRTDYILNEFGLGMYFDAVFSSAHVGSRKEDASFWNYVETTKGIHPPETLFWDDEHENIKVARQTGFIAELFTDMDDFNQKMYRHFPELRERLSTQKR